MAAVRAIYDYIVELAIFESKVSVTSENQIQHRDVLAVVVACNSTIIVERTASLPGGCFSCAL